MMFLHYNSKSFILFSILSGKASFYSRVLVASFEQYCKKMIEQSCSFEYSVLLNLGT